MTPIEIQVNRFSDAIRSVVSEALKERWSNLTILDIESIREVSTLKSKLVGPNRLGSTIRFSNLITVEYISTGAGNDSDFEIRFRSMQWDVDKVQLLTATESLWVLLESCQEPIRKIFADFKPTLLP